MSTLTLKPELKSNPKLDQIIEQNNLLIEQNKKIIELLSRQKKPTNTKQDLKESLLANFLPGNNYNAMLKLIRYLPKLSNPESIRTILVDKGIKQQHLKLFDKALNDIRSKDSSQNV